MIEVYVNTSFDGPTLEWKCFAFDQVRSSIVTTCKRVPGLRHNLNIELL